MPIFVDILKQIGAMPDAIGLVYNTKHSITLATGLQHKLALRELEKRGLIELVEVETAEEPVLRLAVILFPWL